MSELVTIEYKGRNIQIGMDKFWSILTSSEVLSYRAGNEGDLRPDHKEFYEDRISNIKKIKDRLGDSIL